MTGGATPRRGAAALLEALRAPLLLSPAADVAAGWVLVASASPALDRGTRLPMTALGACALLAAGMAQNALADHEDDRRHKPDRPLPRGAVSETTLQRAWALLTLAGLALLAPATGTLALGLTIVLGSWAYHAGLKEHRVPGCVLLGLLRGSSMGLGLAAAMATAEGAADPSLGFLGCGLYTLYLAGASLHASTDDQPADDEQTERWSGLGLAMSCGVLWLWLLFAGIRTAAGDWPAVGGAGVFVWALFRLASARTRLPPPAVTGVALSGLHLLHAGTCFLVGAYPTGGVILGLYGVSRLLLRVYPPS